MTMGAQKHFSVHTQHGAVQRQEHTRIDYAFSDAIRFFGPDG